jgi:hypothetical protein
MHQTGIARTLAALNFQLTDRLPIVGGRIRQTQFLLEITRLTEEVFWANPRRAAVLAAERIGADSVFGPTVPLADSPIGAASHIKWGSDAFRSPEDVARYVDELPSPSEIERTFDATREYDRYTGMVRAGQAECGDMLFIPFSGLTMPFHGFYELFGMEHFLMAMQLYPDAMRRLFEHEADKLVLRNRAVADAIIKEGLPPYIWGGEDICGNQGPVASPRLLARIYFPAAARAVEPLRAAGIRLIWHSDGNIMPIVPHLLNTVGVDGFQGIQEETGVDLTALSRMTTLRGQPTILVGGINVPTVHFGGPEQVCAEVDRAAALAEARGGGMLLCPASSFGPDVPTATMHALYDCARRRTLQRSSTENPLHATH